MNFFLLFSILMVVLGFVLYQKKKLDDFASGFLLSTLLYSLSFSYLSDFSTNISGSFYLTFFGFYLFIVPAATLIFTSLTVFYKKSTSIEDKTKEVA